MNLRELTESSVFIVAELSSNHNQNFATAIELVRAAHKVGANAVKIQIYLPHLMTTPGYVIESGLWKGGSLSQLYERSYLPWDWIPKLQIEAEKNGLIFFASVFDKESLDAFDLPIYKISSFEINDVPFLEKVAQKNKPVIVSTGTASIEEISKAVSLFDDIALLHCVSDYPAFPEQMGLLNIQLLRDMFDVPVGLSDHSFGPAPFAAVALGARIIEKHLTLSRDTIDGKFSLLPEQFEEMVSGVRKVERMLSYENHRYNTVFRRSLHTIADIKKGQILTEKNVKSLRPNIGLAPTSKVFGTKAKIDLVAGTPLVKEHINGKS